MYFFIAISIRHCERSEAMTVKKKKLAAGSIASHPHYSDEPNERSTGASVLTALRFRAYFVGRLCRPYLV